MDSALCRDQQLKCWKVCTFRHKRTKDSNLFSHGHGVTVLPSQNEPNLSDYCCCLVTMSCPTLFATPCPLPKVPRPWDFPDTNTGGGCHFLLQGIFLTRGGNPRLLHLQVNSLPLSHQGSPNSSDTFH